MFRTGLAVSMYPEKELVLEVCGTDRNKATLTLRLHALNGCDNCCFTRNRLCKIAMLAALTPDRYIEKTIRNGST